MKRLPDEELVRLFAAGNEDAFDILLHRVKSKVFSTIYLIVKDRDLAEDLFQDVMFKVVNVIRSNGYNEEGKFLPWVSRIGRNLAIDYFRKGKRVTFQRDKDEYSVFYNIPRSEPGPEQILVIEEDVVRIRELVQQLPDTQREVLIMRHYGDLSFKEIADLTDVSINTALGRMRYALINLRKMMGMAGDEVRYGKKVQ